MRTVGCLIFDGVRAFDYAVIGEVWANRASRPGLPAFDLRVCGPDGARVRLGGGLERVPDHGTAALADCDLVVVPGVEDPGAARDPAVLAALRAVRARGVPIASLCAGAFVLAEAGLLDGREATTHWAVAPELARRFPAVTVRPEVLFTGGDGLWTSAGVAAGIDLCLHLVRTAHGQRPPPPSPAPWSPRPSGPAARPSSSPPRCRPPPPTIPFPGSAPRSSPPWTPPGASPGWPRPP